MARWDFWGGYFPPSVPREAEGGIKARSRRGAFGESWWAKQWIESFERYGWGSRLQRGRRYARRGQVLDFELAAGAIHASVQGSRRKPYQVQITVKPLSDRTWTRVVAALAKKAGFAARLLAGEMPEDIEEAFTAAKASLFPKPGAELKTDCSCPDWANPCKHLAAVFYLIGEELDRDPFLLFQLRGRSREQLLDELRKHWTGDDSAAGTQAELEPEEPPAPLRDDSTGFWGDPQALTGFRTDLRRPPVLTALLQRLGEPAFWHAETSLLDSLRPWYNAVSERALSEAFEQEAEQSPSRT